MWASLKGLKTSSTTQNGPWSQLGLDISALSLRIHKKEVFLKDGSVVCLSKDLLLSEHPLLIKHFYTLLKIYLAKLVVVYVFRVFFDIEEAGAMGASLLILTPLPMVNWPA